MMPHIRTVVGCGVLACASILSGIPSAAVSAPRLMFPCSAPTAAAMVTYRLLRDRTPAVP